MILIYLAGRVGVIVENRAPKVKSAKGNILNLRYVPVCDNQKMQTNLKALVFVDCYALSNDLPSKDHWRLLTEAYEAINSADERSAVVAGGPGKWEITFHKLLSTDALDIKPTFVKDFRPEYESCEIYSLKSTQVMDRQIRIEIASDYINGHFLCESVQVKPLEETINR